MRKKEENTYQRANDGTQVENDPKGGNVSTLLVLGRISHHDSTLGSPEQSGAHTKESTGKDDEANVLVVVVAEERGAVDAVTKTTNSDGETETETVGKGAREETNDGKGRVQSDGRVILGLGVDLTTTSQTTQRVVHAGAEETHQSNQQQLDSGRGVVDLMAKDLVTLVDPSIGSVNILVLGGGVFVDGSHLGGGFHDVLLLISHGEEERRRPFLIAYKPEGRLSLSRVSTLGRKQSVSVLGCRSCARKFQREVAEAVEQDWGADSEEKEKLKRGSREESGGPDDI